jgi:hypothetical protein
MKGLSRARDGNSPSSKCSEADVASKDFAIFYILWEVKLKALFVLHTIFLLSKRDIAAEGPG